MKVYNKIQTLKNLSADQGQVLALFFQRGRSVIEPFPTLFSMGFYFGIKRY